MQTRADDPQSGADVHVASRLHLLAQTVCAGLAGTGIGADVVDVRVSPGELARRVRPSDVVVLLEDLETARDVRRVRQLMRGCPAHWLVLSTSTEDAYWGAMLEAGASVLPATASLEQVDGAVRALRQGRPAGSMDAEEARRLVGEWTHRRAETRTIAEGLRRLTPREREALVLMIEGQTAADIAETTGVSEVAIRSRIKSVLRKLEVHSQLAAVAAVRRFAELLDPEAPDGDGGPPGQAAGG